MWLCCFLIFLQLAGTLITPTSFYLQSFPSSLSDMPEYTNLLQDLQLLLNVFQENSKSSVKPLQDLTLCLFPTLPQSHPIYSKDRTPLLLHHLSKSYPSLSPAQMPPCVPDIPGHLLFHHTPAKHVFSLTQLTDTVI